ncbi:MAG: extracellular solute-binding protein [Butyricicoccus sp.]|nr:extracellular solute-binding protein [Butyricicoccus pullicaecorum]MDY5971269.1 extracellular solute-binding protein [Butyricicoccus sp.]
MKTKRLLAALTASALVATLFAGCGGSGSGSDNAAADSGSADTSSSASAGKTTVNVWATGSDNVRQIFETLVEDFNTNSEYKDTYEAKLNFLLSGTGGATLPDMLISSYKANQEKTDFDVMDLGDEDVTKVLSMVGEDAIQPLDFSKIPNAEKVSAKPIALEGKLQPYRGTTVVLAYNSDKIPENEVPTTYDELEQWIKDHPGRFVYNTPGTGGAGDSFARTTVYNLIDDPSALTSSDPKWMEQWDAGFEKLKELHPYMYKSGGTIVYPNKNQGALDLLTQGEIDMCPMWADMVLSQRKAGIVPESVKITTIQPSFQGSVQGICVPASSSNPEGGFAFINYILSADAQTLLVQQMAAIPVVTDGVDLSGAEDLMNLDTSKFRTMGIGDLGTDFNARWDDEIGTLG